MKFVTSGTSDTFIRYFGLRKNFQENYPTCEICRLRLEFSQNNWREFVFE